MNRFSLANKRALVTGAARGIGLTVASALADAGAAVVLGGRDHAALEPSAETLRASGAEAWPLVLDVSSPAAIADGFARLARRVDRLDILVNNAGVEEVRPASSVDGALWDRVLGTNLRGAFFCCQNALPLMPGGGAILNLCSLASEVGIPGSVPYGASKAGLQGMTRGLASEWASRGIRVNGIGPGYFRTAMTEPFYADHEWRAKMLAKIPLGRFGRLDDLAGAAVFLCSDAAAYITGQVLYIDGGYLASM